MAGLPLLPVSGLIILLWMATVPLEAPRDASPLGLALATEVVPSSTQPPILVQPRLGHGSEMPELFASLAPSIQALLVTRDQTVYAGSFGLGIYRSNTRGESWSMANTGLGDRFILSLVATPDGTVYAGTLKAGVFRTKDAGRTWQPFNVGLEGLQVKALLVQGGFLYAGTGDGVFIMKPGAEGWTAVADGLKGILVHALVMATDETLYAGTSGKGVVQYKKNTSKWTRLSQGLVDHEGLGENFVRVLAMGPDQSLYVGTFDGGVFQSRDRGQSWRPISRALPNDSIRGIVINKRGLFVGTGRGIFMSQNYGQKWSPLNNGLTELAVQVLAESGDGSLYVGTSSGVFRTDDDGKHWIRISSGMRPPRQ